MARPVSKNIENTVNVKNAIYDSAIALFAENGFSATSIKDIAERAKVTKAMVHYYFESKEKLFDSIMSSALEMFDSSFKEIESEKYINSDIKIKINAFIQTYIQNYIENPEISKIFLRETIAGGEVSSIHIVEHYTKCFERLASILENSKELNNINTNFLSRALFGMGLMFVAGHFLVNKPINAKELAENITNLFLTGAGNKLC